MVKIVLVDEAHKHHGFAAMLHAPLTAFLAIFSKYWPAQATLEVADKPVKGAWNFLFLDNADVADALGYHDYLHGLPLTKVFVETTLNDGQDVGVTASHELAEMLVDPTCALTAKGPKGLIYAYETADAVEETDFFVMGNRRMTNFVLPAWFQNAAHPAGTKFDYLGKCSKPFQLLPGGYAAVQKKNGQWTQIFGSWEKAKRFAQEDRRGHRVENRISRK